MDSYNKKIETYFSKKQKYEKKKASAIRKIMGNDDYTLAEKRKHIADLKLGCIQCKKKVNTIFGIKDNVYFAKCGSTTSPCKLNLSIPRKTIQQLKSIIDELKISLAEVKEKITKTKLDYLFKYANEEETVGIFEEQKELMLNLNEALVSLEEDYKVRLGEEERKAATEKQRQILHKNIDLIKKNHRDYKETGENQYLKDNARIVKDVILPLQAEMRKTKHDINLVELHDETTYRLYQVKHSIAKSEKEIVA